MPVRWGLLGCGDIARKRVARALAEEPRSRLLAACRRDEAKLHAFCQAFAIERAYTRDAGLLADLDLDAVYIATPVRLHLPQTLAAARAGKHVLVEKPMALTVAECAALIEARRAARVAEAVPEQVALAAALRGLTGRPPLAPRELMEHSLTRPGKLADGVADGKLSAGPGVASRAARSGSN